jgi:4-diphosphocytidyl-2-C-methyl-D-erythritol kinase
MYVHRLAAGVIVRAPAKLNLFFEVLARRNDGYHEIETLMVPIGLYDTLAARDDPKGNLHLECWWDVAESGGVGNDGDSLGVLPAPEDNLAYRAVRVLRERAGIDRGISLRLSKTIPSAAGLGGGSSDAAAALLAANEVWQLNWSRGQLAELAAELGSDVPFFLLGGAAICRGRGERIEPLAGATPLHFVVVRPPVGLSTAAVYKHCQVAAQPRGVAPLVTALRAGDVRNLDQLIHNRLQDAAEALCPWIATLNRELAAQDCLADQMSGSGTSYFGICRHALHARRVARRLQSRGLGRVYTASTCN